MVLTVVKGNSYSSPASTHLMNNPGGSVISEKSRKQS